jgi:DNA-binding response OmpR family regulator
VAKRVQGWAQADDLLVYPKELREKISILVVDDDKRVRDFLRYNMQEEGFTVYEAGEGSRALELARNIRPSVILLDTVMPGMDGYEVLEALKEDQATENIPVVILSGSEDSKVAMELGATHYLVKPIVRGSLIKAVNEILSKTMGNSHKSGGILQ